MRLLIAEDDRALAMFLTRGMEADGHRVRCATDGAEAVSAFVAEMPDLTILDLNLPVMDAGRSVRLFLSLFLSFAVAGPVQAQTTGQSTPPPRTTLNQPVLPSLSGVPEQVVATSAHLDAARLPFPSGSARQH